MKLDLGLLLLSLAVATPALAAPPILHRQPFHQSPVHGLPDDLLMIAGRGFAATDVVVYRRIIDPTVPLTPPLVVPLTPTADLGAVPVVSTSNIPDSLTVRLPPVLLAGRPYALWVRNAAGEWSAALKINDPRPLWVSPAMGYTTARLAGLPRKLKVVGRNLRPYHPRVPTLVRLAGPTTYVLTAEIEAGTAIDDYAARVSLPGTMPAGTYQVSVSTNGGASYAVAPQTYEVQANPLAQAQFAVSSYGCFASDGLDDTHCFTDAILAAQPVGGVVTLGPGVWDLAPTPATWFGIQGLHPELLDGNNGLVVPVGVSLRGSGKLATTVMRGPSWPSYVTFSLQGHNTVSDARWEDAGVYNASAAIGGYFQLGRAAHAPPSGPSPVSDVIVTDSAFVRPLIAIVAGGLPIRRLYIARNEINAYRVGLDLTGNPQLANVKFHIDESVITQNFLTPGEYVDACMKQGVIGSALGASFRVDFSENDFEGRDTEHMAVDAPPGWRAGMFWALNGNVQQVLVSKNVLTCTGDKAGDGEALALDANLDQLGYSGVRGAVAASVNSVTIPGPLDNPVAPGFFDEHWIQVANGAGLGQVRKIVSITPVGPNVQIVVSPPWDVVPVPQSSVLTVGRQYWQVYTVDNTVDNRGCTGVNANGKKDVGVIGYAGTTADSTMEGNIQHESGGLALSALDISMDPPFSGNARYYQYFNEIRGNFIFGENDYASGCSNSGVQLKFGGWSGSLAAPDAQPSKAVVAYGISIARNTVMHADGLHGGGVTLAEGSYSPAGSRLLLNTLIHHNTIDDLPQTPGGTSLLDTCLGPYPCEDLQRGICVNIRRPEIHDSVLYANGCTQAQTPVLDNGTQTIVLP